MSHFSAWSHGYPTTDTYSCDFHRELAPNWLDLACLAKGYRTPRGSEGSSFRYLDLGCGMGFGLCLLACLYPEGEFVGVDYHPDHHAHAEDLRLRLGLTNLSFKEADFLELANDPYVLGEFQYVVSHGIFSWVRSDVQTALLKIAAASMSHGAIFYCSINSMPGWLSGSILQMMCQLELRREDTATPMRAISRSISTLRQLLGPESQPTALGQTLPILRHHLGQVEALSPSYLPQEYGCSDWRPLYSFEFHELCLGHKLSHISSATLTELGDDLLPENIRALVRIEANPSIRETLIDLATNKSFRRDLFMRGKNLLSPEERLQQLNSLSVRLIESSELSSYSFATSYGNVIGDPESYKQLEQHLAAGPRTLKALSSALDRSTSEIVGMVLLLMHTGRTGLERGPVANESARITNQALPVLQQLAISGRPYGYLPAPAIGSAISFSLVEHLTTQALSEGVEPSLVPACVQIGLQEIGKRLNDKAGNPYDNPDDELNALSSIQEKLCQSRLAALHKLGVFS